jgi:dihydrofolate reductase
LRRFKAIAAMSENRVIGRGAAIPWRIPEDLNWFKRMTVGHVVVMGRKTFESIGGALPDRTTVVLSRSRSNFPGANVAPSLDAVCVGSKEQEVFICGGGQVYSQALHLCSDLYLTLVKEVCEGDVFFPPFEEMFELENIILDRPDIRISHYRNRSA